MGGRTEGVQRAIGKPSGRLRRGETPAPDEKILAQKDYFSVTIVTPLSPSP